MCIVCTKRGNQKNELMKGIISSTEFHTDAHGGVLHSLFSEQQIINRRATTHWPVIN